jgi:hypothetical protein
MTVACRDVEAATLARDGSPPITRTTFPTCRAHYPGGSSGCACRLLPRSCSLPQMAGGSASALSLSRPAQASLALRPVGLLSRPKATFVTRLQPFRLPGRAARQLPDQSTTIRVESSSTGDSRLRGRTANIASIPLCPRHVRFAPNSDHKADMPAGRFGATTGHWPKPRVRTFEGRLTLRAVLIGDGSKRPGGLGNGSSPLLSAQSHLAAHHGRPYHGTTRAAEDVRPPPADCRPPHIS